MNELQQAARTNHGLTSAPVVGQRISPIDEAMVALRNTQGATLKLLDDLTSRLEPVLQPVPVGETKSGANEPHASLLHGEIIERGSAAGEIHSRIRSLIERLTV